MKKLASIVLTVVLAISCNFLERDPYTSIAFNNVYKTEKDMNLAANGLYGVLQSFYQTYYPEYSELPSDNLNCGNGSSDTGGQFDFFTLTPTNSFLSNAWNSSYHIIHQCNLVLKYNPGIDYSSDSLKNRIEGEARFVRGLTYFNLVRMFGDIPIVDHIQTQAEARAARRDPAADVYELIISDLSTAVSLLPASYSGDNIGRATKYAAETLLAKVYLTIHEYDDVLPLLEDVISSKKYQLLPNYGDIFLPENAGNKEMIFEIQFEGGNLGEGSRWGFRAHPRAIAGAMGISASDASIPSKSIMNALGTGNPRADASYGAMTYSGTTRNHLKKHYMEHGVQNSSDDNWPLLRYADVLLMYAEAHNETVDTPDSLDIDYINQIRRRAYGLNKTDTSKDVNNLEKMDKVAFRNTIWKERRLELAFEGHRWFDLVRTGEYVTVMNEHALDEGKQITVHDWNNLYPVPQAQIDINPNLLPNNPGY